MLSTWFPLFLLALQATCAPILKKRAEFAIRYSDNSFDPSISEAGRQNAERELQGRITEEIELAIGEASLLAGLASGIARGNALFGQYFGGISPEDYELVRENFVRVASIATEVPDLIPIVIHLDRDTGANGEALSAATQAWWDDDDTSMHIMWDRFLRNFDRLDADVPPGIPGQEPRLSRGALILHELLHSPSIGHIRNDDIIDQIMPVLPDPNNPFPEIEPITGPLDPDNPIPEIEPIPGPSNQVDTRPRAYGRQRAALLARTDPQRAMRNSDSYALFAQDVYSNNQVPTPGSSGARPMPSLPIGVDAWDFTPNLHESIEEPRPYVRPFWNFCYTALDCNTS